MPIADQPLPDWRRAHGSPLFQGLIKQSPEDFKVDELAAFELSDSGEHDWLRIQKVGANTNWVARGLAAHAGVPVRDVGYAGQKDRHALTTQWFSVRRPSAAGTNWDSLDLAGVSILERRRNGRKLKRGAHRGNRFRLVVRNVAIDADCLDARLRAIRAAGVPNYFGPQRFGRPGGNLRLAERLFSGERLPGHKRSMAISSARSFLFNEVLSARVDAGTWNRIMAGEPVNLDGSGSFFVPTSIDDELISRLEAFDVHPTGPLWGAGDCGCSEETQDFERAACAADGDYLDGLIRYRSRLDVVGRYAGNRFRARSRLLRYRGPARIHERYG
jgi:tRNA pseudouridine13 synthase